MIARYQRAASLIDEDALLMGPVGYLPPPPARGYDLALLDQTSRPHPSRPTLDEHELAAEPNPNLFWSLSFAVSAPCWQRLGGFDEGYRGYGAEDTDLGQRAQAAGVTMHWVGGAWAHHQWHPASSASASHLDEIVENATRFHARWGWWPMAGWLEGFRAQGLLRYDVQNDAWIVTGKANESGEKRHEQTTTR